MAKAQLIYINRSAGNGTANAPAAVYKTVPIDDTAASPAAEATFRSCLIVPVEEDILAVIGFNPDINDLTQQIFIPAGDHYEFIVAAGLKVAILGLGTNVNGGSGGGGSGGVTDTVKIDPAGNTVKVDSSSPIPISIQSVAGGELDVAITAPVDVIGPLTNTQLRASAVPVSGPLL
uniref:Virion structural protein n=1 Tax=Rhizobium phage LG08 TaxID=3129229 RepID=A0AAU8HXV8_9CAUD